MIIKLCKCHLIYLVNRLFIYVFIIITILNLAYNIFVINSMDKYLSLVEESKFYYLSCFQIYRLEILLFTLLISSFFFISNNDQYRALILPSGISRNKYFITKIVTITCLLLIITIFEGLLIMIVAGIWNIDFYLDFVLCEIDLIISLLYFMLVSVLFIQITYSIYIIIGSFVLLLFTSLDIGNSFFKYFICIVNENMRFFVSEIYYIFFVCLLLVINIILYNKRDLQT